MYLSPIYTGDAERFLAILQQVQRYLPDTATIDDASQWLDDQLTEIDPTFVLLYVIPSPQLQNILSHLLEMLPDEATVLHAHALLRSYLIRQPIGALLEDVIQQLNSQVMNRRYKSWLEVRA